MTAAIAAMGYAAIEAELALRRLRAGDGAGRQTHGGWAILLAAVGVFLFVMHLVFG